MANPNLDDIDQQEIDQQEIELEEDAQAQIDLEQAYERLSSAKQHLAAVDARRGLLGEAHDLTVSAAEDLRQAAEHADRAAGDREQEQLLDNTAKVHQLAVVVRDPAKTSVAELSTAVVQLTGAVQKLSVRELTEVAHGNPIPGRQLREQVTFLGTNIKQGLSRVATLTMAETIHLVQQLVEFVAAVLTLADHIKPLFDLFRLYEPVLAPFVFR